MNKVFEVIVIFFFMIGFLTTMGIVINYCADLWFNKFKKK